MNARSAVLLAGILAGYAAFGPRTEPAASSSVPAGFVAAGIDVVHLDIVEETASEGQVVVRVRNTGPEPVILGVDVRAEPGLWLAPARQETTLFYLAPNAERTVYAPYGFFRLSPLAVLRVRVGAAVEHVDGGVHVPEPVAVRRFDLGKSDEAQAFMNRFDTRASRTVTIHALRGTLSASELDRIAVERERAIGELARMLNVEPPPGLRIVFYPDGASKTADTRHVGNGLTRGKIIVEIRNDSVRLDPYHELVHVMAGQLGWAPPWLSEGFAVWVTERLGADALEFVGSPGKTVEQAVCGFERAGELLPMAELLRLPDIGPAESRPHVSYAQAASFVGFLADSFSIAALRRAYATLTPSATEEANEAAFASAFGMRSLDAAASWSARTRRLCALTESRPRGGM